MFYMEGVCSYIEVIVKLTFRQFRSSHPEVFCKKDVLKNFEKFTRKDMWGVSFLGNLKGSKGPIK